MEVLLAKDHCTGKSCVIIWCIAPWSPGQWNRLAYAINLCIRHSWVADSGVSQTSDEASGEHFATLSTDCYNLRIRGAILC